MSATATALAPIRAARRRLDGGFSVDGSGYDPELAKWARRVSTVGWSTTIEGLAELGDDPFIVVVGRSMLGTEPLVTAAALADERSQQVRCAELIDIRVVDSWQRRLGLISPSLAEVSGALGSGHCVVMDARHVLTAVTASLTHRCAVVPAAVMTSQLRRRRAVLLGTRQYTEATGPLAAARLRDAIAAELQRTALSARATWRLA
jgi:hypothetical protein